MGLFSFAEAVAETIGSVMEHYHQGQYTRGGEVDNSFQKEMFLRLNGPTSGMGKEFIEAILSFHTGSTQVHST